MYSQSNIEYNTSDNFVWPRISNNVQFTLIRVLIALEGRSGALFVSFGVVRFPIYRVDVLIDERLIPLPGKLVETNKNSMEKICRH